MRWQDKLSKKQLKHLRKVEDVHTLIGFRRLRLRQRTQSPACWECNLIAEKLGIKVNV